MKLIQIDEQELDIFNYVRKFDGVDVSSLKNSHMNFNRNRLDNQLAIKITNEEEKYEYFIRKLIEDPEKYPEFVSLNYFIIRR